MFASPVLALAVTVTSVRSSNRNQSASASSISVTAPTGTTAGDVVIVIVTGNASVGQGVVSDNNGSTPFTKDFTVDNSSPYNQSTTVFSRRIIAGDPASYSFSYSVTDRMTIVAVTFQNPNPNKIYDVAPATGNTNRVSGPSTGDSLSITTQMSRSIHCIVATPDSNSTAITGTPSGYTIEQNGGTQTIAFGDKVILGGTATGIQTWTQAIGSNGLFLLSFSIANTDLPKFGFNYGGTKFNYGKYFFR